MRTGFERNENLPDQKEHMKKKVEAETLPNSRLLPKKLIHLCSDFLSDPKFHKRLTLGLREQLDRFTTCQNPLWSPTDELLHAIEYLHQPSRILFEPQ